MISEFPRKIVVERDAVNKVSEIANLFGDRILIVADSVTKEVCAEKISKQVGGSLIVINNSTLDEVKRVQAMEADCILSAGGGKVIDVGKLAAHNKKIPFISFPTACSHDGIASRNASILESGKLKSFLASTPYAVIADLDIISKSPYRLTAAGAADVLSNYTAVFDWKLKDHIQASCDLSILAADLVHSSISEIKGKTDSGLSNLLWSLIFSGMSMSIAGSSHPASGAEHMFSHALDKIGEFGLHGEQVGIGTIFFSYLQGQDWEKIKSDLSNLGAPSKASELKISEDVLIKAFMESKSIRNRYTILDEKPLTKELVKEVCNKTGLL